MPVREAHYPITTPYSTKCRVDRVSFTEQPGSLRGGYISPVGTLYCGTDGPRSVSHTFAHLQAITRLLLQQCFRLIGQQCPGLTSDLGLGPGDRVGTVTASSLLVLL